MAVRAIGSWPTSSTRQAAANGSGSGPTIDDVVAVVDGKHRKQTRGKGERIGVGHLSVRNWCCGAFRGKSHLSGVRPPEQDLPGGFEEPTPELLIGLQVVTFCPFVPSENDQESLLFPNIGDRGNRPFEPLSVVLGSRTVEDGYPPRPPGRVVPPHHD